jgi:hypothetical protein
MKIINLFKKIFFPTFIYEFYSSIPEDSYIEKANHNLELLGAQILCKENDSLAFYVSSYKIRKLSYGKLLIKIKKSKTREYNFRIKFVTHKSIFYLIAFLLSLFIVINVAMAANTTKILAIPFTLLSGHIYFWSMVPSGVKKIKTFLMKLGTSEGSQKR